MKLLLLSLSPSLSVFIPIVWDGLLFTKVLPWRHLISSLYATFIIIRIRPHFLLISGHTCCCCLSLASASTHLTYLSCPCSKPSCSFSFFFHWSHSGVSLDGGIVRQLSICPPLEPADNKDFLMKKTWQPTHSTAAPSVIMQQVTPGKV